MFPSTLPSLWQSAIVTASVLFIWSLLQAFYNVFLHRLAHFPGPRAAACTRWWLGYTELFRSVSLSDLRPQLHEKYGDIVRVAPNELHFSNPSAYNDIYNSQNKWDKDYQLYKAFDADMSFFTQVKYADSKRNRTLVSNSFSRQAIYKLQSLVIDKLDIFCRALKDQYTTGRSSDLYLGFQCFSADTIATFCFAKCFDQLSAPDFNADLVHALDIGITSFTPRKYSRIIIWLMRNFPRWALTRISPKVIALVDCERAIQDQVTEILANPSVMDAASHRTIYRELLDPDANKGRALPTAMQLQHDGLLLFAAGSHTVAVTLMSGVHHLLHSPAAKCRLIDELRTGWPNLDEPPSFEDLEQLPFLTAVVKESLRIAPTVPAGLPRIVPPSGATIAGVRIPGGTIVSQSSLFVSRSAEIFDRPLDFVPERWLQPDSKALEAWLVPFSRGPRSCLGINLAYCELYLAFAHLFRRFDVQIDTQRPANFTWSEHFVGILDAPSLRAHCRPLAE